MGDCAPIDLSYSLSQLGVAAADWARVDHSSRSGFRVPRSEAVVVHMVLSGSMDVQVDHEFVGHLQVGDAAILLTGADHAVRARAGLPIQQLQPFGQYGGLDAPVDIDFATANGDDVPAAVSLMGRLYLSNQITDLLDRDIIPPLINSIRKSSVDAVTRAALLDETSKSYCGVFCVTKYAEMMMVRVVRDLLDELPRGSLRSNDSHERKIARAVRMIAAQPGNPWTVANLAEAVGMSRSAFAEKFLLNTGQTPMDVVISHRMQEAARLLEKSGARVKEVAARVGYHSESAFSRRFVRTFGRVPTSVRHA